MMLTMTPRTMIAARTDRKGRAASGIVGSGIRVVFLGDCSRIVADATVSGNRDYQTQEAGKNNISQTFYRHDATSTFAKHRHGVDHHSEDGGRDGRVLSSAWRSLCGEG